MATDIFPGDLVEQANPVGAKLLELGKVRLVNLVPMPCPDGTYMHLLLALVRQSDFEDFVKALAIAAEGVSADLTEAERAHELWSLAQTMALKYIGFNSVAELCAGLGEGEPVQELFRQGELGVFLAPPGSAAFLDVMAFTTFPYWPHQTIEACRDAWGVAVRNVQVLNPATGRFRRGV